MIPRCAELRSQPIDAQLTKKCIELEEMQAKDCSKVYGAPQKVQCLREVSRWLQPQRSRFADGIVDAIGVGAVREGVRSVRDAVSQF